MFFGLRTNMDKIARALGLLASGMGVNSVCRKNDVTADSLRDWVLLAARYVTEFSAYLDAHIDFVAQVMNYTRTNNALKIQINPGAALFEQKYLHRTPAMAEGLFDEKLTIKELLSQRPKLINKP